MSTPNRVLTLPNTAQIPKDGKANNKKFTIDCQETDVRRHNEGRPEETLQPLAKQAAAESSSDKHMVVDTQSHARKKAGKGRAGEADNAWTAFAPGTEEEWQEMFRRLGRYATLHGHVSPSLSLSTGSMG